MHPCSISYLCREWDRIHKSDDYTTAPNAYHIGFLDFTLFEDHPEFYATYRLRNAKDGYEYSDKLTLSVVELKHTDLATDEDKQYGIDKWARLFKSTTWEEVKSLTENNAFIQSAARSMFKREVDESTLRLRRGFSSFKFPKCVSRYVTDSRRHRTVPVSSSHGCVFHRREIYSRFQTD